MLSHVRRERFLAITLPAVEIKCLGAAEVAGIASTRLANTLNQGKRCTALRRHSSPERILVLVKGKGASLPYLNLPVSDLCARKVERIHSSISGDCDQEIIDIFDWVIDVSWHLNSWPHQRLQMTIPRRSAQSWSCQVWPGHIARIEKHGGDLFLEKIDMVKWSEDCFYYCSERNNVVVLFRTLKVQSFILTEVSDCGLLIVVTSSTFLKRKDILKGKSS